MAEQPTRRTLLLPMDLGSPAKYEQSVFPLSRVQGKSTINQVDLVLEATLDEIFKIRQMVGNTENSQRLIHNAKAQYDQIMTDKGKIERQRKSLNPIKIFSAYRSVRLLLEAGKVLYTETRTASERMRRQLLSVNTEDLQPVEYDNLPPNARIGGVAIPLDSEFQPDETTASFFTEAASFIASQVDLLGEGNPFADEHEVEDSQANAEHGSGSSSATDPAAATSDGGTATSTNSRLSGVSGNNYFFFQNSYVASRSAIQTPTLNSGGSHNQGATTR
ncbi:hypothetical protein BDR04DRAFT_1140864 [Suillus decipiens]|nr:hypothetical protein BDR04DRAFT_1140864 [Suillus decipiens]